MLIRCQSIKIFVRITKSSGCDKEKETICISLGRFAPVFFLRFLLLRISFVIEEIEDVFFPVEWKSSSVNADSLIDNFQSLDVSCQWPLFTRFDMYH